MPRTNINELMAFVTVARERSFTRAAAQLGVTPSALSHTMRGLEERLGIRLLTRTTRSVTPTEAGERLLGSLGPKFEEIEAEVEAVTALRDKPAGTVRLTATENAVETVIWPALRRLLPDYPDIHVEVVIDYGLTDIVAERLDAGIRMGEQVARDMIAVAVGPQMRMAVVGAPSYFERLGQPRSPQDLTAHSCLNLRLPHGGSYVWEFEKGGRELRVRVEGQLTFNSSHPILEACLDGFGLAYLTEAEVAPHLEAGVLIRVLADWCPPFPGYHLYYPSRRQLPPAFAVVLDALRYRTPRPS